jgi:predicted XRE-type DNA-binding protein
MLEVKGRVILGEDEFVGSLADHLKKYEHVPEILRSRRYANRSSLDNIFNESPVQGQEKSETERWLRLLNKQFLQSEIARYLRLHASTVSNLVRNRADTITKDLTLWVIMSFEKSPIGYIMTDDG